MDDTVCQIEECSGPFLSKHAHFRRAQSNLRESDLELVRRYGILQHRTGCRFYFVRRRDVEKHRRAEPRLAKLHDLVVIVSGDDTTVITVYRNPEALKDIRRKSKMQWRDTERSA